MNLAAIDLFGYQNRDQIWSDSILDLYWEPGARKKYTQTIQKQGFAKDYPIKLRKIDGSSFDALISAVPYEIGGQVIGYQGFIHDISKELKSEQERKQLLRQQAVIDDLSITMGTIITLDDLYQCIAAHINDLFEPDVLYIFKFESEQEIARVEYEWRLDNSNKTGELFNVRFDFLDLSFQKHIIHSGVSLCIPDLWNYLREQNLEDTIDDLSILGISHLNEISDQLDCSMLLSPLTVENQLIGVIQLLKQEKGTYCQEDLEVLTRIANVVGIGLRKAYLYKESQNLVEKLSALQRIEQVVLENLSLPTTLDILVDQLIKELHVDAADILYYHPKLKSLKFITQAGFRQNVLQHTDLAIGEGYAGVAAQTRSTRFIQDLTKVDCELTTTLEFTAEEFISYIGVPLLAKGKLVGVLEIYTRSQLDPDQEWMDLVEMAAGLAAIAIDIQNLQNDLEQSHKKITKAFDAIIEGWAKALELRGIEAEGHSRRIVDLSLRLAKKLGINGDTLLGIRRGALLHDIGKMGIPDHILLKGGKLTKEERGIVARHPRDAFELLKTNDSLHAALDIPLYHHERWDGEGYPYGLAEEEIPLHARIFAIVDVWDALLTDRPYRKAWSKKDALTHIKKQSGKHFDPQVVDAFLEILAEDKIFDL